MAKKKEKKSEGFDLAVLVGAAEDMNAIMGLEPEIDTDLDEAELVEAIKFEAEEVMSKDKFSDATWGLLEKMGVAEEAIADRKKVAEAAEADDEDEGEEDPEEEDEEEDGASDNSEDEEEDDEDENNKKGGGKTTKKKTEKKEVKKAEKKTAKPAAEKKPAKTKADVVAAIFALASKKAMSKEEFLAELTKMFPDREAVSMAKTVNVQISGRMAKEKKVTIIENKGKYKVK